MKPWKKLKIILLLEDDVCVFGMKKRGENVYFAIETHIV